MTDAPQQPSSPSTLYRSAIVCVLILAVLLYLLWRGPPTETALARHAYLKNGFIYYPLMGIFATACASIAAINIKHIICLKNR